jgi:tRNA (cytidine/uridine-2'-O-)-methyltransferase
MPLNIVLHQPEIPANTGNIARTCLATGASLHLIKPLGFSIDDRQLKRAGLDYWHDVDIHLWDSLDTLFAATPASASRRFRFTTKTDRPYYTVPFQPGDWFIFGRETKGLPESLLTAPGSQCVTIPMAAAPSPVRSLNLSVAVAVAIFEARRQFATTP